MSRPIKFRAWDEERGEMVTDFVNSDRKPYLSTNGELVRSTWHTLMQFTGLTDKNGKEIYEGDIVKGIIVTPQLLVGQTREDSSTAMGGYVEYNHSGYNLIAIQSMCDPEREGNANWFPFMSDDPYEGDFQDMEIIGNIYENPELLAA